MRYLEYSHTLTYIMITYRTLTAGVNADSDTVPNPAARTAVACSKPRAKRVPSGTDAMASLPISRTRKKNQSVTLYGYQQVADVVWPGMGLLESNDNCE
jgi:hypothetical protein